MEESLGKIRRAGNGNQKQAASLLAAVEASLSEHKTELTPTAYFTALNSTLQSLATAEEVSRELELAVLSLLSLVSPHVPTAVLRQQHRALLQATGSAFAFYSSNPHSLQQPALKALLACLTPSYRALSAAELQQPATQHVFLTGLLPLVGGPHPKLRRTAQASVSAILASPPAPSVSHPYAPVAGAFIVSELERLAASGQGAVRRESGSEGTSEASQAIGLLAFVRSIAKDFPSSHISQLTACLLTLPRLSNPYLTTSSYAALESLFSLSSDSFEAGKVRSTLLGVLAQRPEDKDERLLPGWLNAVEHGWVAFARVDGRSCSAELGKEGRVEDIVRLCGNKSPLVRKGAAGCSAAVARYCFTDDDIKTSLLNGDNEASQGRDGRPKKGKSVAARDGTALGQMLAAVLEGLRLSGLYSPNSLPALLSIATALAHRLRVRLESWPMLPSAPRPPAAAESLLAPHVIATGTLRQQEGMEYRESCDEFLSAFSLVCGPEALLHLLPLQLEASLEGNGEGRGWVLPLLRNGGITNTRLGHFVEEFVPISGRLFERKKESLKSKDSRQVEAKVCEALIEQIWGLLPGYCDMPWDLPTAFTKGFAELVSQVLYTQPTLRPPIFRALQLLVERNVNFARSSSPANVARASFGFSPANAQGNVALLGNMASNILSVMFNVFSKVDRDSRGFVLEGIQAWLSILDEHNVTSTYKKVKGLFEQAVKAPLPAKGSASASDRSSPTHTMLDLLIAIVPHVSPATGADLLHLATSDEVLNSKDAGVQKRGYRALTRLCGATGAKLAVVENVDPLVSKLTGSVGTVAAGAKRDRTCLLVALLPILPSNRLDLIPALLPEAVLGTKESNAETRNASHDLLVCMARRMKEPGGSVDRSRIPGAADGEVMKTDESEATAQASVVEFITMLSAGLAGTSPHMVSATIMALSRILFEFHDELPADTANELITTIDLLLGSANKEIVKSAIGFVKVSVVCLPTSLVMPHLAALVPSLLNWSQEHRNHFKTNIRSIFERLVRKYGFEAIAELCPQDDRKLVTSIRKKQRKAMEKKAAARESGRGRGADGELSEADSGKEDAKPQMGTAYENVLYGSDSDEAESDHEANPKGGNARNKGRRQSREPGDQMQIQEGEDEVLDLLDAKAASRITTGKLSKLEKRRAKVAADAVSYKRDPSSGRMVIPEDSETTDSDTDRVRKPAQDSTNAYLEAIRGEDGFTRDSRGKVKWNKANVKRSREEAEAEAVEEVEDALAGMQVRGEVGTGGKGKRRKVAKQKLGAEFKAKKAGGDVSKGGMAPYAYLPLSSVRGGGRAKIDITGKKRGSRR